MATYRQISDSAIAEGAPLSQPTMQALKDNQLAIPQGEGNAPRVKALGIELATSSAETKDISVFRYHCIKQNYDSSNQDNDTVMGKEYIFGRGGTFAVHIVSQGSSNHSKVQVKLYKNGSVIQTGASSFGTVENWYQIAFAPLDKIKIELIDTDTSTTFQLGKAWVFVYCDNPLGDAQHDLGRFAALTAGTLTYGVLSLPDIY